MTNKGECTVSSIEHSSIRSKPFEIQLNREMVPSIEKTSTYSGGLVWRIVNEIYSPISRKTRVIYSDLISLILYYGGLDIDVVSAVAKDYEVPEEYFYHLYYWIRLSTLLLGGLNPSDYPGIIELRTIMRRTTKNEKHYNLIRKRQYPYRLTKSVNIRIWKGIHRIYKDLSSILNTHTHDIISTMIINASLSSNVLDQVFGKHIKISDEKERIMLTNTITEAFATGNTSILEKIKEIRTIRRYNWGETRIIVMKTAWRIWRQLTGW